MENNAELKEFMYSISVNGAKYTYSLTNPPLRIADMFSYIKDVDGQTMMHNAIFEEIFHQYFTIEYEISNYSKLSVTKSEESIEQFERFHNLSNTSRFLNSIIFHTLHIPSESNTVFSQKIYHKIQDRKYHYTHKSCCAA